MIRTMRKLYTVYSQAGIDGLSHSIRDFLYYRSMKVRSWYNLKYCGHTDADKNKIVYVDPNDIMFETGSTVGSQLNKEAAVYAGGWDQLVANFRDRYQVKSLINHFEEGYDWKETEYYDRLNLDLRRYGKARKGDITDEEDIEAFFERVDTVFNRIKKEGYKAQSTLMKTRPKETRDWNNDTKTPISNEIGINIGRNGELLWHTRGQHRLCIAQILDIDEVPVNIITRHAQWQSVRDEIRSAKEWENLSEKIKKKIKHPDLEDVVERSDKINI